jgi:23S rRNA-/tRNA-specific pseudouridylate synthase
LNIVFEDESVIVIDKPEGLLMMATASERSNRGTMAERDQTRGHALRAIAVNQSTVS